MTRFNIRLWSTDKNGQPTRTAEWLQERFELFERYCLPSILNQTNQAFRWIVLFDADTPQEYKQRVEGYCQRCSQLVPVWVPAKEGRYFLRIFQQCIGREVQVGERLITTYLDNDDALHRDYVERVQQLAEGAKNRTFVSFKYGLQYFTQLNIATRVPYRNNHFLSLIEYCEAMAGVKTVMGHGSHIDVGRFKGTRALFIDTPEAPAWIEVIHDRNMDNDVKMTPDTHLITQRDHLQREYGIDLMLAADSRKIYYTHFLKRAVKEVFRHLRLKVTGRNWS